MRDKDAKQVNVTMPGEKKTELEEYCAENGLSLNQAMNKAMDLLFLDTLSAKAPEQGANIEAFELAIRRLLSLYRGAIEASLTAREAAEKDVKGQLEGMASLAENNKKMQADLQTKTEEAAKLKTLSEMQQKRIAELEKALSEAKESREQVLQLKETVATLTQEKADLQAAHNAEIARLQNDNFEKILKVVKAGK